MSNKRRDYRGRFVKGSVPWNKGLPKERQPMYGKEMDPETRRKISESLMGKTGWNKGLTKETDQRVRRQSESLKLLLQDPKVRQCWHIPKRKKDDLMKIEKFCKVCDIRLTEENWIKRNAGRICEDCYNEYVREQWQEQRRAYQAKAVTTRFIKYLGVCICPNCGKKGYKRLTENINTITKTSYGYSEVVHHQHSEKGKTVHDGYCYVKYYPEYPLALDSFRT